MPNIVYQRLDGSGTTLDVAVGTTVMQAALSAGIKGIIAECGGNAMCATCHVYVDPGRLFVLPEMQPHEDEMLECVVSPREPQSRLSCQLVVTAEFDGLVISIPETQT